MLAKFLRELKSRRIIREMGYNADQRGIINRYLREEGWLNHLQNTRNFILESAKNKQKDTVVVLGSGWWLDVPVAELSQMFEEVYLVDILHPAMIKQKAKRFGNVKLITADITGGAIEQVYNIIKQWKKTGFKPPLTSIQLDFKNFGFDSKLQIDYLVSVNLMNQLDILVTDYLKKFDIYTNEEIHEFKVLIQKYHLTLFQKDKSCLVTDYEELTSDSEEDLKRELYERKPLIHVRLPQSAKQKQWQWFFDSNKTYYKSKITVFNVKATNF